MQKESGCKTLGVTYIGHQREQLAQIRDPVRCDHFTCPRDSWLATPYAVLLAPKHVPSQFLDQWLLMLIIFLKIET